MCHPCYPYRRRQPLSLLFAVLAALLLVACEQAVTEAPAPRAERPTPVAALEVQPRDLSRQLMFSAPVEPLAYVRLASRSSGTVAAVHVETGDRVRRGQLLAELDLAEAAAELARAQAQAEQADADYRRIARLRQQEVATPAELQAVQLRLRVAQSERELWETRLAFGRLIAPRAAVVTARHIEPGESVQALAVAFELAAMDALVLRPGVSELDVVHLAVGQSLAVQLDALPDLSLEGKIRRIFPLADAASRLVTVEIALPADAFEQGVRPGFLARARLAVEGRSEALAVPAAAIGEDGDGRYVYAIEQQRLQRRPVETGVSRGPWTEIVDGLTAGEIVLASNPIDMRPAQPVRIVAWRG